MHLVYIAVAMPPITLTIEIVASVPPNMPKPGKGQQSVQNERRTPKPRAQFIRIALTFDVVTQLVCPLLCFVDFLPMQSVFDRDLLIQLLVGHTPLHKTN